jgi:hypothetical protein
LFWGAVGNSVIVGTAIGWAVNAVVYGLVALVIIWRSQNHQCYRSQNFKLRHYPCIRTGGRG